MHCTAMPPTAPLPRFRGSTTDPRDRAYRDAITAMDGLLAHRRATNGTTRELERLERIVSSLTDLARGQG